jgi:selenide,water dikinase
LAAVDTLSEASTTLVGGHSISASVPFFGLAIIGFADVGRTMLIKNSQPGDNLILTKPLGTGVIITAQKTGVATREAVVMSENVMLESNRKVSVLAVAAGIDAATDVSGFGLLGHLHNVLFASGCAASLDLGTVPVLPEAHDILKTHGTVPHSAERNLFALDGQIAWNDAPYDLRFILSDPQTSGGLLLSANDAELERFSSDCHNSGQMARVIGRVHEGPPGTIQIITPKASR